MTYKKGVFSRTVQFGFVQILQIYDSKAHRGFGRLRILVILMILKHIVALGIVSFFSAQESGLSEMPLTPLVPIFLKSFPVSIPAFRPSLVTILPGSHSKEGPRSVV